MPDHGFGSSIWKNAQAVRFGKDGGLHAPVRASGRDGIVVGLDVAAGSDASPKAATPFKPGPVRRFLARIARRRAS